MFDDVAPSGPKLPIDDLEANAVQRLGRWMRVVGTIQLALSGMALLLFGLSVGCGALAGGALGLIPLVMMALPAVYLFQALRIQAGGEQFKSLADDRDVDYLELAFVRLKAVYIVDLVLAVLVGLLTFGGSL